MTEIIQNSKSEIQNSQTLRVTEIFRSIQGESTHAGKPCAFIRLTGCPMRCRWCDSEYTFTGGEKISIDNVLNQIRAYNINLVEVTGGEPLAQKPAFPLITRLCDENYEVLIETGGYVSTENVDERAKIILDVKCPTSGEQTRNHWQNLSRLRRDKDEIKFVVETIEDVEFARNVIKEYDLENRTNAILISPIFGTPNLIAITEFVFTSGLNVRLNLQLHKYVWGRDVHGV